MNDQVHLPAGGGSTISCSLDHFDRSGVHENAIGALLLSLAVQLYRIGLPPPPKESM
jgi:hypothetical protein